MSRRPRSTESPISLFTFLDVLMCTMGALILLLIGLSMKMRPKADMEDLFSPVPAVNQPAQPSEKEPETSLPVPPRYTAEDRDRDLAERAARRERLYNELSAAVASVRADRDRVQQQLQERLRIIAKAEQKLTEVRAKAERAGSQSEAAQQARAAAAAAEKKLNGLEAELVEQIETTRRNLDLENRKQATASNEYALVPYDGTSGTMRRPIYIECTKHGYRFVPENEFVGPEHLDGFSENYNPLLTGTQALLRYWNARRRESGGQDPEPYVLLIVRPSGSLAYYLARKLLAPLGANFGYELVEEDWKLAVSDPDPQARAVLHDAIEITVGTREKVRATMAGAGRSGPLAFNGNHRAISRGELKEGFDPGGPGAGRNNGREPDSGGFDTPDGLSPAGPAGRSASVAGGKSGPARAFADRTGPGLAGGAERPAGGGNGFSNDGTAGAGAGGRTPRSVEYAGKSRGGPGGGGSGLEAFGDPADGQPLPGSGDQPPGAGGARTVTQRGRMGGARPATLGGGGFDPESEDSSGGGGGRSRSRGAGPSGVAGDGGDEPQLVPLPDEVAPPRGQTPRTLAANQSRPPGRLRTLEPDVEGSYAGSPDGEPGGTQKGVQGVPSAGRSAPKGGGTGSPGGGAVGEDSSGVISLGSSGGESGGETPHPGGKKRWGKSHGRAGIGLERKLEIHAKADRLLIGPNDAAIPVTPGEKTDELMQRVMQGIEQTTHSWGAPPANFYWLPAVKFVVYPGGNGHYERLRGPLEKLGVTSTVQYVAATTSAKSQGGARQ